MRRHFQIIEEPTEPIPIYGQGYVLRPIPKQFNPTQKALQTIKIEVQKFKNFKSEDPDGFLKNISISVYSEGKGKRLQQIYNFKIKAKIDPDYYKGHIFEGRIQFPDNYPNQPPSVIMNYLQNNKPLQMVNLYGDGAVCHHTISEEYYQYPKFDLPYILSEIEGLLYRPNPKDPANGLLGVYFQKYPNSYWKFQRQQAKLLPLGKQE